MWHGFVLERILRGTSDKNIEFESLCALLKRLGFDERVKGDHHIFSKNGVAEMGVQAVGARPPARPSA